jgi:hypothetical protein
METTSCRIPASQAVISSERYEVSWKSTDVSEEHDSTIFDLLFDFPSRRVSQTSNQYVADNSMLECDILEISDLLFKLQMGFYPVAVVLQ